MLNKLITLTTIGLLILGITSSVYAEEKPKKETEIDYIAEAQPYLHLSCEGLVNALGEDEEKLEKAIGLMMAVSLINRNIDITKLITTKEAEGEFREFLEKALRKQCENDAQTLMAAYVDRAIVYAFSATPEEKEKEKAK